MLSSHELFVLASFDYLSVQKMYTQSYNDISEEALLQTLKDKERQRQSRTASARDHNSSATAFLRTVELSGSSMWGSDGRRAQCRRRAFAYQTRFGQPALFVTLTPNVADSFVMAQYCGCHLR
ncbi:hypothetical protein PHMEG_00031412 [Phytophthora megakarya]|uniref:Helitron helicase-like domain-containing protein n=1 Tax=Phytophthora megakarya TaxID=4795 RepID=A0A225V0I4_9STRA|nr:hypothetical protein PHMEG_00031412 [Phytophthora megakarya]